MAIYRMIMAVLAPFLLLRALWRGETRADVAQRLGRGAGHRVDLWLHGASLGELASARWVIEALLAARPGLRVVVTCNTVTGRQMVAGWDMAGVTAQLAPLDLRLALRGFLDRWQPRALINLEGEFWPLRFALCAERGLPVLLLGARMSERSFGRWQRRPALVKAALGGIGFASAQDAVSRQRLLALGLNATAIGPDLDLKAQAVAHLAPVVQAPRATRAEWLLAASTHEGEEALILTAFDAQTRFTHLILAPRHPDRAGQITALRPGMGQRSLGAEPGQTAVYLADTLGEMDLWYARCGAVVIGGSFADKGGHSPWEPARHGTAMLHGPSTSNFTTPFADLDAAGGAVAVTADNLAAQLDRLDGDAQDRLASTATAVLQATGDVSVVLNSIVKVSRI